MSILVLKAANVALASNFSWLKIHTQTWIPAYLLRWNIRFFSRIQLQDWLVHYFFCPIRKIPKQIPVLEDYNFFAWMHCLINFKRTKQLTNRPIQFYGIRYLDKCWEIASWRKQWTGASWRPTCGRSAGLPFSRTLCRCCRFRRRCSPNVLTHARSLDGPIHLLKTKYLASFIIQLVHSLLTYFLPCYLLPTSHAYTNRAYVHCIRGKSKVVKYQGNRSFSKIFSSSKN